MTKGTPKTLLEAIDNGIDEHCDNWQKMEKPEEEYIRLNVKDFLAQKFMTAMLKADLGKFNPKTDLKALYEEITQCQA